MEMNLWNYCKRTAAMIAAVIFAVSFTDAVVADSSDLNGFEHKDNRYVLQQKKQTLPKTKSMKIKSSFALPGKNSLTLDELVCSETAHKITFHTAKKGLKQDIELRAQDDQRTTIRFSMAKFANGKGVFENNFVIEDGAPVRNWIAEDAKTLTITVYQNGFSESDEDVWQQVGDALTLDLTKLKKREKKK
jgi:hypothetical protein